MSSLPEKDKNSVIGKVTIYICRKCDIAHGQGKTCPKCGGMCEIYKVWD